MVDQIVMIILCACFYGLGYIFGKTKACSKYWEYLKQLFE